MNKRKWTEIYIPDITRKLKYKASNFTKNCGIPFEPRHSMWYAGWHYRLLNIDKKSLALFSKQWNEVEKTRIHGSIAREGLGFKRAVEKNGISIPAYFHCEFLMYTTDALTDYDVIPCLHFTLAASCPVYGIHPEPNTQEPCISVPLTDSSFAPSDQHQFPLSISIHYQEKQGS